MQLSFLKIWLVRERRKKDEIPEKSIDISVQIFTISGKLVRTLNGSTDSGNKSCCGSTTAGTSRDIIWDGRDDFGQKIGKGTYIYKLKVHSPSTNKTAEKIEKLVIL